MKRTNLKDKDNNTLTQKLWFPIGTIYENENDVSEDIKKCFYGTWEFYGKGKFLVGVDESDADFKANKTGGEKAHKLTISEMPSHNHTFNADQTAGGMTDGLKSGVQSYWAKYTNNVGGDQPHNNLPPYQAVYRWKRVS